MTTASLLRQLKELDQKRQKLVKGAHDAALAMAQRAVDDVNALGFEYRIVSASSGAAEVKKAAASASAAPAKPKSTTKPKSKTKAKAKSATKAKSTTKTKAKAKTKAKSAAAVKSAPVRRRTRRAGTRDKVIRVVRDQGPIKRGAILVVLGVKGDRRAEQSVSNALANLKKAGVFINTDGAYTIA